MGKANRKFETSPKNTDDKVRELGNRKKFHPHDLISLQPKTASQEKYLDAHFSGTEVIFQDGPAGTGKSLMAMYAAFTEVFDESSPYDRVIMIRTSVESRSQGFLPGTQEEKNEPFEAPYQAISDFIINSYRENYKNLKALGYYEFMTTSHLRGLTFDDAIIIVDECQNATYEELHTVITRVGINAKVVFIGDSKQDDLKNKRGENSGFHKFKKVLALMPYDMVGFVDYGLDDIVRSGIVKEFLKADYSYTEDHSR